MPVQLQHLRCLHLDEDSSHRSLCDTYPYCIILVISLGWLHVGGLRMKPHLSILGALCTNQARSLRHFPKVWTLTSLKGRLWADLT